MGGRSRTDDKRSIRLTRRLIAALQKAHNGELLSEERVRKLAHQLLNEHGRTAGHSLDLDRRMSLIFAITSTLTMLAERQVDDPMSKALARSALARRRYIARRIGDDMGWMVWDRVDECFLDETEITNRTFVELFHATVEPAAETRDDKNDADASPLAG